MNSAAQKPQACNAYYVTDSRPVTVCSLAKLAKFIYFHFYLDEDEYARRDTGSTTSSQTLTLSALTASYVMINDDIEFDTVTREFNYMLAHLLLALNV